MIIHKFKKTYIGTVLNRPSKKNKSPYLADVKYNAKKYIAHTPFHQQDLNLFTLPKVYLIHQTFMLLNVQSSSNN